MRPVVPGPVHNGLMLNRTATGVVPALLAALLLAGCSGDEGDDTPAEPSSSTASSGATSEASAATSTDGPYLPVPPGTELTAQGSELEVGDTAVVAWEPRQETVGVLEVRVERLEQTTFKESFAGWKIEGATRKSNPYFVRGHVENVGETDLGGFAVPLYAVDGTNTLIEYSGFGSTFKPCSSTDFPKRFAPGASRDFCLVYLAPEKGDLAAVSFRPTQEFNPITWTGELTSPKPASAKGGKGGKGGKAGGKNDQQGAGGS